MLIEIRCHNCNMLNKVELTEDLKTKYICSHCALESETDLCKEKYQVLFDLGIICLKNGYYKEAVSDLASSLERCFEFAIRAILAKNNFEISKINSLWKEVINQSERQYGAFLFLFSKEFNIDFRLDQNQSGFRNDIIHKGKLPLFDSTYKYANYIYCKICNIISILHINGYTTNYIDKQYKDNNTKNGANAYSSFIENFELCKYDGDKHEYYIDIPDFDNLYNEFYRNNEFVVPFG